MTPKSGHTSLARRGSGEGPINTNNTIPIVNILVVNVPIVNIPIVNIPIVNLPIVNIPIVNIPTVNVPTIKTQKTTCGNHEKTHTNDTPLARHSRKLGSEYSNIQ